jgi:hypothetical protein
MRKTEFLNKIKDDANVGDKAVHHIVHGTREPVVSCVLRSPLDETPINCSKGSNVSSISFSYALFSSFSFSYILHLSLCSSYFFVCGLSIHGSKSAKRLK